MSLKEKSKTLAQWWFLNLSKHVDVLTELVTLEDVEKDQVEKEKKLKLWIFGLYKRADHLSHEDERQSCACILRDNFGVETEEGMFGELFLTEKSQKELEELLKA